LGNFAKVSQSWKIIRLQLPFLSGANRLSLEMENRKTKTLYH
jgi:hypothetical protein